MIVTTVRPERLIKEGLPTSLTLDLSIAPDKVGPMIKTKWRDKWKFTAYEYPPDICKWFSVAVAKEVKAIRAGLKYRNDIKKLY